MASSSQMGCAVLVLCALLAVMSEGSCPRLIVPGYFDAAAHAASWNETIAVVGADGGGMVVINPNSGPGLQTADSYSAWVSVSMRARAAGIPVLGYVYTGAGSVNPSSVQTQVGQYISWFQVSGFMLDDVATNNSGLSYYTQLSHYIRNTSAPYLMLYAYALPPVEYYAIADNIVSFWGSAAAYNSSSYSPSWTASYPASHFTHFVKSASALQPSLGLAQTRNDGFLYVTSTNNFNQLSPYIAAQVACRNASSSSSSTSSPAAAHSSSSRASSSSSSPPRSSSSSSSSSSPASSGGSCPRIVIPAYFDPGLPWNQSIQGAPAVAFMIMNPSNGVGKSFDSAYLQVVQQAQAAGIAVLGYLLTRQGKVALSTVLSQIATYASWYGVDGYFIDNVPEKIATSLAELSYYANVSSAIRARPSGRFVMCNPGGPIIAENYTAVCDNIVIYEGSLKGFLDGYRDGDFPSWQAALPAVRFTVIINDASTLNPALADIEQHNFGYMFIAANDKYNGLPSYWKQEYQCGG